jgi:putative flippase GtrA
LIRLSVNEHCEFYHHTLLAETKAIALTILAILVVNKRITFKTIRTISFRSLKNGVRMDRWT